MAIECFFENFSEKKKKKWTEIITVPNMTQIKHLGRHVSKLFKHIPLSWHSQHVAPVLPKASTLLGLSTLNYSNKTIFV